MYRAYLSRSLRIRNSLRILSVLGSLGMLLGASAVFLGSEVAVALELFKQRHKETSVEPQQDSPRLLARREVALLSSRDAKLFLGAANRSRRQLKGAHPSSPKDLEICQDRLCLSQSPSYKNSEFLFPSLNLYYLDLDQSQNPTYWRKTWQ